MNLNHVPVSIAVILNLISAPLRANEAYLDPGSGSYLLQLLLAGLLGSLFVVKASWGKIKGFFRQLFNRSEETPPDEE